MGGSTASNGLHQSQWPGLSRLPSRQKPTIPAVERRLLGYPVRVPGEPTVAAVDPVRIVRPSPYTSEWSRSSRSSRLGSQRDRKSTRLNSSHVAISYAVFCLKKKTQK